MWRTHIRKANVRIYRQNWSIYMDHLGQFVFGTRGMMDGKAQRQVYTLRDMCAYTIGGRISDWAGTAIIYDFALFFFFLLFISFTSTVKCQLL